MHSNGRAQDEPEDDVFAEGSKFVSLNNVSITGGTKRQTRARKPKEVRKGKRSTFVRTGKKGRADALGDGGCGADTYTQENGQHAHNASFPAAAATITPSSAYVNAAAATHQLAATQSVPGLPSASASLSAAAATITPSSAYVSAAAATHQLAATQSVPGLPSASASLSAAAATISPSSAYVIAATHQLAASHTIPGLPSASASPSAAPATISPSSAFVTAAATYQLAASHGDSSARCHSVSPGLPSASASLSAAAATITPSSAYVNAAAATHQLAATQSVPGLPSASASLSAAAATISPPPPPMSTQRRGLISLLPGSLPPLPMCTSRFLASPGPPLHLDRPPCHLLPVHSHPRPPISILGCNPTSS
ncbi:unnamed protein product, partial [Closterium sp. NIES-65]